MLPLAQNHRLSIRSRRRAKHMHHDLKAVVWRASELLRHMNGGVVDFAIGEVDRDLKTQRRYVATGKSTTMNSRHLIAMLRENVRFVPRAAAVDLIALSDGKVSWDWPLYHILAKAMKQAAEELGVPIVWGGDWKSFPDGPHFQLDWAAYPKGGAL